MARGRPRAGPRRTSLARGLAGLIGLVALGCGSLLGPPPAERIPPALSDLSREGFDFETDVRFSADPYAVCEGVACAEVAVIAGHRTILIAREAFTSDARLRATLLEIWERYREPRPGSVRDLARGALRILEDGPRVGVDDIRTLRLAHHTYRQHWSDLPSDRREGLLDPDRVPFP